MNHVFSFMIYSRKVGFLDIFGRKLNKNPRWLPPRVSESYLIEFFDPKIVLLAFWIVFLSELEAKIQPSEDFNGGHVETWQPYWIQALHREALGYTWFFLISGMGLRGFIGLFLHVHIFFRIY